MPLIRNVFGYSPRPHSINEPKSLYQSPSGATGSDFTQACRRCRSASGMRRSSTRSRRCCYKLRGRSEKRIFGNCVLSKDGANQVLSRFVLLGGFMLLDESSVGGTQFCFRVVFGLNSAFSQRHKRTADREMTFLGDPAHLDRQRRRDSYTLAQRPGLGPLRSWLRSARHLSDFTPQRTTVVQFAASFALVRLSRYSKNGSRSRRSTEVLCLALR